jgi:hypothetical protein
MPSTDIASPPCSCTRTGRTPDARNAGDLLLLGPAAQLRRGPEAHHADRGSGRHREPGPELVEGLPRGGARRQQRDPGVDEPELEGRQCGDPEDDEHADQRHDGTPLDHGGEPGEDAALGRDIPEPPGQPAQPRDALGDPGAQQPVRGEGEQGRDERERDGERHQDDADPGGTDRAQQGGGEQQQPGEADRDGQPAEEHGAAGGSEGPLERAVRLLAQLLTEPAGHEQAVVDAQAQSEHRDHADRTAVEVDEVGEAEEHRQRARDRRDGAGDRQAGGEEAAEHDDHHEQARRQRDDLPRPQVARELTSDLVGDRADAADVADGAGDAPGRREQARRDVGEGSALAVRPEIADQLDGDEQCAPVARHQRRAAL